MDSTLPIQSATVIIEDYLPSSSTLASTTPAVVATSFTPGSPSDTISPTPTTSPQPQTQTTENSSTGVPTAAKWGIAIGSACLFIVFVSAASLLWAYWTKVRKSRKQATSTNTTDEMYINTTAGRSEDDWDTNIGYEYGYELYGDLKQKPERKGKADTDVSSWHDHTWLELGLEGGAAKVGGEDGGREPPEQEPYGKPTSISIQTPKGYVRELAIPPVELESNSRQPMELE